MEEESTNHNASKIVLLGTGTPNPNPERSGPSVAIVVNETSYLVDFGPDVVRRAAAAYKSGIKGLNARNLKRAFLTHLHSDHSAGYSDLILTPWVMERDAPLEVYGPSGITEMTDHILAAYEADIKERIEGLQPSNDVGYKVNTHIIKPGVIYEDSNVRVEAFRVNHGSLEAYGFKFHTQDRTIAISGDTAPADDLIEKYYGSDVLIHEVYSFGGYENYPPEWKRYHSTVHTSSHKLAEIASMVKPGLLILYHQLFGRGSEKQILDEVQSGYEGLVVSGKDLEVY
jgi:ribonuclease BN (tRNA processing enzyme)